MKKEANKFVILAMSVVIAVIVAGIYYTFFYTQKFEAGAEGLFLSSEYEEKYKVVTADINVNKTKFNKLVIKHEIDLNQGSVKYELYDPNKNLIDSGEVTKDQVFSKELEVKPVKGKWVVKYTTNEQTDGKYMVYMEGK